MKKTRKVKCPFCGKPVISHDEAMVMRCLGMQPDPRNGVPDYPYEDDSEWGEQLVDTIHSGSNR